MNKHKITDIQTLTYKETQTYKLKKNIKTKNKNQHKHTWESWAVEFYF